MSAPDADYVTAFLTGFDHVRSAHILCAYPVMLDGVRVIVLGRLEPQENGKFSSSPYAVIVNDELAAKMDLTEVRS